MSNRFDGRISLKSVRGCACGNSRRRRVRETDFRDCKELNLKHFHFPDSAFSGREHAHQLSSVNGSQSHLMHSLPRKIPQSCSQHSLNRNGGMGTNNLSLERGRNNAHFHPRNPGYPPLPPDSASASLRRMQQHQAQLQQQQFQQQQQQQQQAQHFYHPNK